MDFVNALTEAREKRGWSMSELGRRAGVSHASISLVTSGQQSPTADFCVKIADALDWSKEDTLRLAGILDPLAPAVTEERELLRLFRDLDPQLRLAILQTVRSLQGIRTVPQPLADNIDFPTVIWNELEKLPRSDREELRRRFVARMEEEKTGQTT